MKGRVDSIRFVRLVSGNLDFSLKSHRAKSTINGLGGREGVTRKKPFNTDLLRVAHRELGRISASRRNGAGPTHFEMFAACILGVLPHPHFRNRIPQMGRHFCRYSRWCDLSVYKDSEIADRRCQRRNFTSAGSNLFALLHVKRFQEWGNGCQFGG